MPNKIISYSIKDLPPDKVSSLLPSMLAKVKAGAHCVIDPKKASSLAVASCVFGTATLNFWTMHEISYERRPKDCVQTPNNNFSVFHIRKGNAEITQNGKKITARAGDCLMLDISKPYAVRHTSNFAFAALQIPKGRLQNLIPSPQKATALAFPRQSPWVQALAATMNALTCDIVEQPFFIQKSLLDQICCLLLFAINPTSKPAKDNTYSMLSRFRQSLHERYYEPNLSPADLAKEHRVSKRTLQSVFAAAKSSFRDELLSVRMENARRLLDDPRFDGKTIAEIGYLVSFLHPSHFTARFSKFHKLSPSAYRSKRQTKTPKAALS